MNYENPSNLLKRIQNNNNKLYRLFTNPLSADTNFQLSHQVKILDIVEKINKDLEKLKNMNLEENNDFGRRYDY